MRWDVIRGVCGSIENVLVNVSWIRDVVVIGL